MESRPSQSTIDRIITDASIATAVETIEWASTTLGSRLCLLSSMQDALLIDLVMRVDSRIPVVFIDTGYHFAETHKTLRAIEQRYGLNVEIVGPLGPVEPNVEPGACCASKRTLLAQALQDRDGWITGISRVQTEQRSHADLVSVDRTGKLKFSPLAQWNQRDRDRYIEQHDLIEHPLVAQGYASIGCAPCTSMTVDGEVRSGRWAGTERTECGLHL